MAKSSSKRPEKPVESKKIDKSFIAVDKKAFDPSLASLFATSSGPVQPPPKSRYHDFQVKAAAEDSSDEEDEEEVDDEELSSGSEELDDEDDEDEDEEMGSGSDESASEETESDNEAALEKIQQTLNGAPDKPNKKRKRGDKEEDVEDVYMQKIEREEAKDEEKRKKKQKTKPAVSEPVKEKKAASDAEESDEDEFTIPKHETQMDATGDEAELEKANRTVFLGNVSSEAITSKTAEKQLKKHLASFIPDLADNKPPHKVESIRFRSTAFSNSLPKRAAFVKKEIMDTTTKSTNAYVVYSTKVAAREAVKRLNGSIILGRHLRVDSVAHPAKVDHRRCVFVGNLGFVDDESNATAEDGKKKSNKPPGDVEEGLWVQFGKAGKVESVRVPRDPQTRVGKGFAYVQFEDENAVEAALQFNDQKYPPLLPRKLRVTRARAQKKNHKQKAAQPAVKPDAAKAKGAYNAKVSGEQKSKEGRIRAVLGKSAAFKTAESFVFEGHRASAKQGTSGLKLGGKNKAAKGPNGRKSRSKAWKASGGKK